ncbi:MAG: NlpC/P60 family protein [Roseovarius sp.]
MSARATRVCVPVADLLRHPDGPRERQLLLGEAVRVIARHEAWVEVAARRDGYRGWLAADVLAPLPAPSHRVAARATHLYPAPDFRTRESATLSLNSLLCGQSSCGRFARTPQGFVPAAHLEALATPPADPVSVAETLLGTPYLWGGNSAFGVDCSGLVQMACLACAIPCPGDSDEQAAALGRALPEGAALRRGDLLFWRGHVAWVADPQTLLHANAFHMAVTFEPIGAAIARIARQGDGPLTARKRLGESP